MISNREIARIIRFLVVGLINTGFGLGVYWLLLYWDFSYQLATAISLIFGVVFSFKNHSSFVFKAPGRFVRYIFVWGLIYIINITFIGLIRGTTGDFLAALVLLPFNVIMGYSLMKYFVYFRENAI